MPTQAQVSSVFCGCAIVIGENLAVGYLATRFESPLGRSNACQGESLEKLYTKTLLISTSATSINPKRIQYVHKVEGYEEGEGKADEFFAHNRASGENCENGSDH